MEQSSPSPIDSAAGASLDTPLTKEELKLALGDMKPGKSSGPDGFTAQYFKSFLEMLSPHFLEAFNSSADTLQPSTSLLTSHVVVLPKPEKDPTLVTNFDPMSLLNTDVKLYTKMLANRL